MSVAHNSKLSERLAVVVALTPTALTTSVTGVTGTYVNILTNTNAVNFARLLGEVVLSGPDTGTTNVQIWKATDTSGTGATAILSTAYSASAAGPKVVLFDFNTINMDTAKPCLAIHVDASGTGTTVAGVIMGGDCRFDPAASFNATTVNATIGSL